MVLLMGILPSCLMHSQTYYYRLAKKVVNGNTSTSVSGGQFITFMADICYESNKKGVGVGHGTLQRNSNFSNTQFKVYFGKSYWDNESTFKFTSDLTTLNVVTENGDIYLYKRTTPPASAKTCSLIRKSSSSGGNAESGITTHSTNPIGDNGIYPSSNTSGGNPINGKYKTQSSGHRCTLCNGTGRKIRENWSGNKTSTKWCNECNKQVGLGHYHTTCDLCGGDGWVN